MQETITIQPQPRTEGKLTELAILKSQLKDFEEQIDFLEQTSGIKQLRAEKAKIETDYLVNLAKAAASVTFSDDRFLQAIKRKGDSYREGNLKLIRNSKTIRNVVAQKFVSAFPDIAAKICSIPVGKAEALIGRVVNL